MKFSSAKLVCIAVVLVVVAALALRFLPGKTSPSVSTGPGPIVASTTVPLFTSAAFFDGDALHGVGPEWTFISQTNLSAQVPPPANPFDGTIAAKMSVIRLTGKTTQLGLSEYSVSDRAALEKKLATYTQATSAGRQGYLVPVADEAGSTGFAIVGTNAILLLQYGNSQSANFAAWPSDLEPEVQSLVASIQVQ